MLKKLCEIITQCSFILKFPRKTDLKRILGKKKSGSWSGANSEPCQISIMELKAVTYFDKKNTFDTVVLNTSLMMTVARYCYSISNPIKQNLCFCLDYGSNYKMNENSNEKMSSCLKKQTKKTNVIKWNEDMNIWTRHNPFITNG